MAEPRGHFGPVVLLGLGSAALVSVAGTRIWVSHTLSPREIGLVNTDRGAMPLAAALGLVLLALWGVLLVTRGGVRRAFAVLTLLAALGVLATVVAGALTLPGDVRDVYSTLVAQGSTLTTGWTGWFWAAVVGAVLGVVAAGLGVRLVGRWPQMGRRYDAPSGTRVAVSTDDPDASTTDLWKAIDDGEDPTATR